jgi:hypothetical protein
MRQKETENQDLSFRTLSARVDIRIHAPEKKGAAWHTELRMVRDTAIILSVQPLAGIEVARIHLDENGFVIINRFDRVYAEGKYDELDISQRIVVPSFTQMQNLLADRVFLEEEQLVFNGLIGMRFSQIHTDIPVATDVDIPPRYRQITMQELVALIKQKL